MKILSNLWTRQSGNNIDRELVVNSLIIFYIFTVMKNGLYILIIGTVTLFCNLFSSGASGPMKANYAMYNDIHVFPPEQQKIIKKILYLDREIINKTIVFNDTKTK